MRSSYRNAEYYTDLTAGIAIENVTREERRINRKPRRHRNRRRNRRGNNRQS